MSLELITKEVGEIKAGLASQIETAANKVVEAKAAEIMKNATDMLATFNQMPKDVTGDMLTKALADVQTLTKDFEQFQLDVKQGKHEGKKTFGEAFGQLIEKNFDAISTVRKGQIVTIPMELKTVGDMTNSASLTGDGVVSYNQRQGILPGTKFNFRDILPTNTSGTLVSVHYKETGGEGSISVQTEGSAKSEKDYDFTEVKTTNKYIAGYARYSKQLMKNLAWLQGVLPRLLRRDFYNAENAAFFTTVSGAATGSTATAQTADVRQLIDWIANQRTAKFNASYILTSWKDIAGMNQTTFTNGYYEASGGVLTRPDGSMTISGVPVIGTDWVTENYALILDTDYIERVEGESVNIQFSEQDKDNFTENKITARIECLEEVNLMLPTSAIYGALGAVS